MKQTQQIAEGTHFSALSTGSFSQLNDYVLPVAPGMEMFGPMHGYMNGDIYGTWIVTSAKVSTGNEAILHLSNDLGSETQEAELTMENDSIFSLKLTDGVVIKKVVKKKLVKIPQKIVFKRIIDERF